MLNGTLSMKPVFHYYEYGSRRAFSSESTEWMIDRIIDYTLHIQKASSRIYICVLKLHSRYDLRHAEHENGLSLTCFMICVLKRLLKLNFRLHIEHMKGFLSVLWVLKWVLNLSLLVKDWPHSAHWACIRFLLSIIIIMSHCVPFQAFRRSKWENNIRKYY